jgi:hypothetical protein
MPSHDHDRFVLSMNLIPAERAISVARTIGELSGKEVVFIGSHTDYPQSECAVITVIANRDAMVGTSTPTAETSNSAEDK